IPPTLPQLSITPTTQSFALVQGGQPTLGQLTVSNTGGGTLKFTAQATSERNWLTLTSSSGMATPSSPVSLGFSVNPTAPTGLHSGQITVTDTVWQKQV